MPCPRRSDSKLGSDQCYCQVGTFRIDDRAIDDDCYPPPVEMRPEELNTTRTDSKLTVAWQPKLGRHELAQTYRYDVNSKP